GIAVARHVDEIEQPVLAEAEEVELARPPRRDRDAREACAAGKRVDQARLADIGAAGERDLRPSVPRQVLDAGDARDEGARAPEQRLAAGKLFRTDAVTLHCHRRARPACRTSPRIAEAPDAPDLLSRLWSLRPPFSSRESART